MTSLSVAHKPACGNARWIEFNVTSSAKVIASGNYSTTVVGLRAASETCMSCGWKRYRWDATFSVEYNRYPSTPGTPSLNPAVTSGSGPSGFIVRDLTPTLYATVSDPDPGHTVRGIFQVYQGSTLKWSGQSSLFASGTKVNATVASGKLAENVLYTVRVWARDNSGLTSKTWSSYIQFKVDVTPPGVAPAVAPVAGQPAVYVEDDWAGGVGQLGKFQFTNGGVSDVVSYKYSFDNTALTQTATGASPTISYTPSTVGVHVLRVQAVDQAGWLSPQRTYTFYVDFAGKTA